MIKSKSNDMVWLRFVDKILKKYVCIVLGLNYSIF